MNAPVPYFKTVASRLGGITNGMVVSWPARLRERGVRRQFTDVTDIAQTVLEAAGIAAPKRLDGVTRQRFDGVGFAYAFDHPDRPAAHRRRYFEVMGHAALYKNGWLAAPAVKDGYKLDLAGPWQLYDLTRDPIQTEDVAARFPARLARLRRGFAAEARRNHLLPLSSDTLAALVPDGRPEPLARPGRYVFHPSPFRYPEGVFSGINNRAWMIAAAVMARARATMASSSRRAGASAAGSWSC